MKHPHVQHICNLTKGGDVLYAAHAGSAISNMLHCISELGLPEVKIYRTNGEQRVTFPWGTTLHFATINTLHRARGRSFWHIVTDSHNYLDNDAFRETLRPCFLSTMHSGIERYSVIG